MSGGFLHLNRNKRSIVLDLKAASGMAALEKLIATADVFVHSLRPKAIYKLGLGYEAVRAIRSDIIYCGAYGFGEKGPYRDKAAYDDIIQAGSGLAALHTVARKAPAFMPTVLCDKLSGQAIAYSVMAALFQREPLGIPGGSRAFSALKAPGTSRNVFGADCARLTDDVPGRRSMMRRAAAHGAEGTGYRRLFAKRKACLRAGLLLLLYCDAVIVVH